MRNAEAGAGEMLLSGPLLRRRLFVKRFLFLCGALFLSLAGMAQAPASTATQTFSSAVAGNGVYLQGAGINSHKISWVPVGTVTTCTLAVDSSVDGVSWTAGGLMAGQTCTGAASFSVVMTTGYYRLNLTTLTGGGSLIVTYTGSNSSNVFPTLPGAVLGCYQVNGRTNTYAALSAGAPLVSFRWGDTSHIAILNHVKVQVIATVAATVAGQAEREIIRATGWTASDTGGTALTPLGNSNKMRSTQPNSLLTDLRVFGGTITAGTRTLDANPMASAVAWLPLNMTGVDIGCSGAAPTGAVWSCVSSQGYIDLLNSANGQDFPPTLGTNEGFIIRIGKDAMPTSAVQQTYFTISWCEANPYS